MMLLLLGISWYETLSSGNAIEYEGAKLLPYAGFVSGAMLLILLLFPPFTAIGINKEAGTVRIVRWLRREAMTLDYQRVRAEIGLKRTGKHHVSEGLLLYYNGDEKIFIGFGESGWSEEQLRTVLDALKHTSGSETKKLAGYRAFLSNYLCLTARFFTSPHSCP